MTKSPLYIHTICRDAIYSRWIISATL